MLFDEKRFYARLQALQASNEPGRTEAFLLDQAEQLAGIVLAGEPGSPCGCFYGTVEGDSRLGGLDQSAKRLEERTLGLVTIYNALGCLCRDNGRHSKAIEFFGRAEEEVRKTGTAAGSEYFGLLVNKGETYRQMGNGDLAMAVFLRAEKLIGAAADKSGPEAKQLFQRMDSLRQDPGNAQNNE